MHSYTERILGLIGERDPLESLAQTPLRLTSLFGQIGDEGMGRSVGPGKWPARAIFAHLADSEIAMGFRIRQALAEEDHQIQAFDQDLWARRYGSAAAREALEAQAALRHWNLTLFRSLGAQELRRVAHHPERGEETIDLMIRLLAGHDLNHLAQLETIAGNKEQNVSPSGVSVR